MKFLGVILLLWLALCVIPDPRPAKSADPEQETLYPSHTCDSGRWYFENSDADSVTVACYPQESAPDPENQ